MKRILTKPILLGVSTALLVLLGFFGYTLLGRELIVGKVLIVQANAVANKMALVQVFAVDRDEALKWRHKVAEDCFFLLNQVEQERTEVEGQLASTRASYDQLLARLDESRSKAEEAMELSRQAWMVDRRNEQTKRRFFALATEGSFPRAVEVGNYGVSSDWQQAHLTIKDLVLPAILEDLAATTRKRDGRLAEISRLSEERIEGLRDNLRRMTSPERLNVIPPHVKVAARDITDDSGEFRLRLPPGDYFVIASGSRRVFNDVERYHWAQPVSTSTQEAEKFLLGNMNQMDVSEDHMWRGLMEEVRNFKVSK